MSDDGMTDADRNWWATRIHAQRLDHVRPLPPRSEPIGPQGQHQDPDYIALANAAPRIPGTFPLPGSGIGRGSTNNFLPAQSRRSWTTPAGTSEYVTHNPLPGRPDEDADRAAYQATQIAAERASRLGGSSTLSRRGFAQQGDGQYRRAAPSRDAADRLRWDWEKVSDPDEDGTAWS